MTEEWRPVLDGNYEVSSRGRVRRAKPGRTTRAGKIIAQHFDGNYWTVSLRVFGRKEKHRFSSHKLIARAFHGPCPRGKEVNHVDRNGRNNAATNLEYLTHQENLLHSGANLSRAGGVLTEAQVRRIRRRLAKGENQTRIARDYGMHKTNISCIARRVTWRHVA